MGVGVSWATGSSAFVGFAGSLASGSRAGLRDTPGVSQQDVEVVRNLFAGAATADKRALLEILPQLIEQACDPEIEWVEDPQRADSRTYRGHAGVRESFERWLEGFDEYSFEIPRRAAGEERERPRRFSGPMRPPQSPAPPRRR